MPAYIPITLVCDRCGTEANSKAPWMALWVFCPEEWTIEDKSQTVASNRGMISIGSVNPVVFSDKADAPFENANMKRFYCKICSELRAEEKLVEEVINS